MRYGYALDRHQVFSLSLGVSSRHRSRSSSEPAKAQARFLQKFRRQFGDSLAEMRDVFVREITEELGCAVVVTRHLDGEQRIKPGYRMRVAVALAPGSCRYDPNTELFQASGTIRAPCASYSASLIAGVSCA